MITADPGTLLITRAPVHARQLAEAATSPSIRINLANETLDLIRKSRNVLERAAASGQRVYGLNTLLGSGRDTTVDAESTLAYQVQIVRYHDSGVGRFLDRPNVRAVILARLIGFTRGGSGVRPETARFYADMLNRDVIPAVPSEGSVGSSDLTQLAAIAAVAIGEGHALGADGALVPGAEALTRAGLEPLRLAAGEALALVSANAYSVGTGALALGHLYRVADLADVALALSLEATARYGGGGNLSPFSPAIQAAKPVDGQRASATAVRRLLSGGWLEDVRPDVSVQDPLSFRAAPQTHGAFRAVTEQLEAALDLELNGRGDNPLNDVDSGQTISGGNFQPTLLALGFESARLALAHVGISSERRIAKLYPPQRAIRARHLKQARDISTREGTATLASEELPGLLWYSAASLLAELKVLAAPATLGAPSLSADVEDHSTLAPLALQQLERSLDAAEKLLTIEALTAVYLLQEAAFKDEASGRKLGKGTGAVVRHLGTLLAKRLPATVLVDQARSSLKEVIDSLVGIRDRDPRVTRAD